MKLEVYEKNWRVILTYFFLVHFNKNFPRFLTLTKIQNDIVLTEKSSSFLLQIDGYFHRKLILRFSSWKHFPDIIRLFKKMNNSWDFVYILDKVQFDYFYGKFILRLYVFRRENIFLSCWRHFSCFSTFSIRTFYDFLTSSLEMVVLDY